MLERQLWDGLLREAYGTPVGDDALFPRRGEDFTLSDNQPEPDRRLTQKKPQRWDMYSIARVSGRLGLFYCNLHPAEQPGSASFFAVPRDSRGLRVRNSAAMVKAGGCSFAGLTAKSASEV